MRCRSSLTRAASARASTLPAERRERRRGPGVGHQARIARRSPEVGRRRDRIIDEEDGEHGGQSDPEPDGLLEAMQRDALHERHPGVVDHRERHHLDAGGGEAAMSRHLQRITVDFEYPVHFTRDALAPANACVRDAIGARVTASIISGWYGRMRSYGNSTASAKACFAARRECSAWMASRSLSRACSMALSTLDGGRIGIAAQATGIAPSLGPAPCSRWPTVRCLIKRL